MRELFPGLAIQIGGGLAHLQIFSPKRLGKVCALCAPRRKPPKESRILPTFCGLRF